MSYWDGDLERLQSFGEVKHSSEIGKHVKYLLNLENITNEVNSVEIEMYFPSGPHYSSKNHVPVFSGIIESIYFAVIPASKKVFHNCLWDLKSCFPWEDFASFGY